MILLDPRSSILAKMTSNFKMIIQLQFKLFIILSLLYVSQAQNLRDNGTLETCVDLEIDCMIQTENENTTISCEEFRSQPIPTDDTTCNRIVSISGRAKNIFNESIALSYQIDDGSASTVLAQVGAVQVIGPLKRSINICDKDHSREEGIQVVKIKISSGFRRNMQPLEKCVDIIENVVLQLPTSPPTSEPTKLLSQQPSQAKSMTPTTTETIAPSLRPTSAISTNPTSILSSRPSPITSMNPTHATILSSRPSLTTSMNPTLVTSNPTLSPSIRLSSSPTTLFPNCVDLQIFCAITTFDGEVVKCADFSSQPVAEPGNCYRTVYLSASIINIIDQPLALSYIIDGKTAITALSDPNTAVQVPNFEKIVNVCPTDRNQKNVLTVEIDIFAAFRKMPSLEVENCKNVKEQFFIPLPDMKVPPSPSPSKNPTPSPIFKPRTASPNPPRTASPTKAPLPTPTPSHSPTQIRPTCVDFHIDCFIRTENDEIKMCADLLPIPFPATGRNCLRTMYLQGYIYNSLDQKIDFTYKIDGANGESLGTAAKTKVRIDDVQRTIDVCAKASDQTKILAYEINIKSSLSSNSKQCKTINEKFFLQSPTLAPSPISDRHAPRHIKSKVNNKYIGFKDNELKLFVDTDDFTKVIFVPTEDSRAVDKVKIQFMNPEEPTYIRLMNNGTVTTTTRSNDIRTEFIKTNYGGHFYFKIKADSGEEHFLAIENDKLTSKQVQDNSCLFFIESTDSFPTVSSPPPTTAPTEQCYVYKKPSKSKKSSKGKTSSHQPTKSPTSSKGNKGSKGGNPPAPSPSSPSKKTKSPTVKNPKGRRKLNSKKGTSSSSKGSKGAKGAKGAKGTKGKKNRKCKTSKGDCNKKKSKEKVRIPNNTNKIWVHFSGEIYSNKTTAISSENKVTILDDLNVFFTGGARGCDVDMKETLEKENVVSMKFTEFLIADAKTRIEGLEDLCEKIEEEFKDMKCVGIAGSIEVLIAAQTSRRRLYNDEKEERIFELVKEMLDEYADTLSEDIDMIVGLRYGSLSRQAYRTSPLDPSASIQKWTWILPTVVVGAVLITLIAFMVLRRDDSRLREVVHQAETFDSVTATLCATPNNNVVQSKVRFPVRAMESMNNDDDDDAVVVGELVYDYDVIGRPTSFNEIEELAAQREQLMKEYTLPNIEEQPRKKEGFDRNITL